MSFFCLLSPIWALSPPSTPRDCGLLQQSALVLQGIEPALVLGDSIPSCALIGSADPGWLLIGENSHTLAAAEQPQSWPHTASEIEDS